MPFMLYNIPNINDVRDKWADDEYLAKKFGAQDLKVTTSTSNHFMVGLDRACAMRCLTLCSLVLQPRQRAAAARLSVRSCWLCH